MNPPACRLRRATVRTATADGRWWLSFADPVTTITAWEIDRVVPALEQAQRAAAAGRWVVGMVSYDAGPAFDQAVVSQHDPGTPLVAFGVFDEALRTESPAADGVWCAGPWEADISEHQHRDDLLAIAEHIAAGDTYQVNHTFRMHAAFDGCTQSFASALDRAQQGDHSAFLDLGGAAVASASPELLVRREGRRLITRPMKGTRPRHADPDVDRRLGDELLAADKDRAENTMIVDMVRNDLGRIAEVGTVDVPALHEIEAYPTVWQMTSTVTAVSDADLVDVFRALFPPASITGAPKYRTSEIIARTERSPRGIYTGAIGVIRPDGDFEFSIAIRTAWIDVAEGVATYGVGGGVVADSTPSAEWAEAHHKAAVLRLAPRPFEIFETISWEPGPGVARIDRHLDRMAASAAALGFAFDRNRARATLAEAASPAACRLRLRLDVAGALALDIDPAPAAVSAPWRVALDSEPVDSADPFLRHKTTIRDRYDAARRRFPNADDVVLWNERGEVTESTIANVVVDLNGRLVTPTLACGLLPGTMRAELLARGEIAEAVVRVDDLERADAIWLVNALRGWIPVVLEMSPAQRPVTSPPVSAVGGLDGVPHRHGRERHVDVLHPEM